MSGLAKLSSFELTPPYILTPLDILQHLSIIMFFSEDIKQ
jgi:hypothetical protein